MDVHETITTRRSVRSFNSKPVEFEKITRVLDSASHAPSAGDLKDFKFVVITDKALLKQVAECAHAQHWISQAPVLIVVVSDYHHTKDLYKERGERLYSVQSCAAATQNILLSAHSMGLSSCWVGAFDEQKLNTLLSISGDKRPQVIIPLGYSDEVVEKESEPELEVMVYFNKYGSKVKNMNLLTREYSKEIEKVTESSKNFFERLSEKLSGMFKK